MILNYQNPSPPTPHGVPARHDRSTTRVFRLASLAVLAVLAVFTVAALNSEGPSAPRRPYRNSYEEKLANDQAMAEAAARIRAEQGDFVVGGER
jgi:hypothetical protein